MISTTGNYGFFNFLTAALCVPLVEDRAWYKLGQMLGLVTSAHGDVPLFTMPSLYHALTAYSIFELPLYACSSLASITFSSVLSLAVTLCVYLPFFLLVTSLSVLLYNRAFRVEVVNIPTWLYKAYIKIQVTQNML